MVEVVNLENLYNAMDWRMVPPEQNRQFDDLVSGLPRFYKSQGVLEACGLSGDDHLAVTTEFVADDTRFISTMVQKYNDTLVGFSVVRSNDSLSDEKNEWSLITRLLDGSDNFKIGGITITKQELSNLIVFIKKYKPDLLIHVLKTESMQNLRPKSISRQDGYIN